MYNYVKRLGDFILAFLALIILSPVFFLVAILIKIESAGPVFFVQKRAGVNGTHFNIYKFRSMKMGTPDLATDKLDDPGKYVTRVGKFLRKTSLDELPQLINIILGNMSFVGPRPALYNQYELIEARYRLGIDRIKPGLTGYAQIMGRDFITDQQKVAYDKYYLDHLSLAFDFKIFFQTFFKIVKAENVKIEVNQNLTRRTRHF